MLCRYIFYHKKYAVHVLLKESLDLLKILTKKELFMKKVFIPFVLIFGFMFTNTAKATLILSLDTPTQQHRLGDLVSVKIMVDGLGDGIGLSLGAFDINIAFDMSALSFAGYNLFDDLGDLNFFEAVDDSLGDLGGGIVNIEESSYISNEDLWEFQPPSFAIAELFFTVVTAPSISQISVDGAVFFDVNGDLINITGVNNTSITAVPSPASSMLMGLGLIVLFIRKNIFHKESTELN